MHYYFIVYALPLVTCLRQYFGAVPTVFNSKKAFFKSHTNRQFSSDDYIRVSTRIRAVRASNNFINQPVCVKTNQEC